MSIYIEETKQWLYGISYILHATKYWSFRMDSYMKHKDLQNSKSLGWYCELCNSRSTKKERYKHTLLKRANWHINGRCPEQKAIDEMAFAVKPL